MLKRGRYYESARLLSRSLRFGGRRHFGEKLKLLIECELRDVGAGKMLDWL